MSDGGSPGKLRRLVAAGEPLPVARARGCGTSPAFPSSTSTARPSARAAPPSRWTRRRVPTSCSPSGPPRRSTALRAGRARRDGGPRRGGEIVIGGVGVSPGYIRRPALTAEIFVPDPYADVPGARMFRTGDLGFFRADGNLVFAGRREHQAKIRGQRLELSEIEEAIRALPSVTDAVVLPRTSAGTTELVGYVASNEAPSAASLRGGLSRVLPEPMIPSRWVVLERFPLGENGKLDRKALPARRRRLPRGSRRADLAPPRAAQRAVARDPPHPAGGAGRRLLRAGGRLHPRHQAGEPAARPPGDTCPGDRDLPLPDGARSDARDRDPHRGARGRGAHSLP